MKKEKRVQLDPEETALLASYESGEWIPVPNLKAEKAKAQKAARNYFLKNSRINIRLANQDLIRLKEVAAYEGLPYQTFISSVLHRIAAGHLSYR
jgi:predicted DNA binding CopG/RHH family protein